LPQSYQTKKTPSGDFFVSLLTIWDDIRTWIESQKLFMFPDTAMAVPAAAEYLRWKCLS